MSANKTAIAIGALLVGGVVGGVIGSALVTRDAGTGASAGVAHPRAGTEPEDTATLEALQTLTDEVRGLRADLAQRAGGPVAERTTPEGGTPELERLAELLDVLATNLKTRPRAGTSPGFQGTPLLVPQGAPRRDRLADVADLPEEERSRAHRFLTYQQVLDRFGAPDHVTGDGIWVYNDPLTRVEVHFHFQDGLVTNVY